MASVVSCATAPLMQESHFNQVAVGSDIAGIEQVFGEPYEIRQLSNGFQEYCYMQRIATGRSGIEQQEFVFVVSQGRVVGKDSKISGSSSFQFSQ
jgi:hypothetical protein